MRLSGLNGGSSHLIPYGMVLIEESNIFIGDMNAVTLLIRALPEAEHTFMCGLVGVVTSQDVGVCLHDTLIVLQHRGQDAAGIMTSDRGKLNLRKDNGLLGGYPDSPHAPTYRPDAVLVARRPTAGSSARTCPAILRKFALRFVPCSQR